METLSIGGNTASGLLKFYLLSEKIDLLTAQPYDSTDIMAIKKKPARRIPSGLKTEKHYPLLDNKPKSQGPKLVHRAIKGEFGKKGYSTRTHHLSGIRCNWMVSGWIPVEEIGRMMLDLLMRKGRIKDFAT